MVVLSIVSNQRVGIDRSSSDETTHDRGASGCNLLLEKWLQSYQHTSYSMVVGRVVTVVATPSAGDAAPQAVQGDTRRSNHAKRTQVVDHDCSPVPGFPGSAKRSLRFTGGMVAG
jgi:hypothetical protein